MRHLRTALHLKHADRIGALQRAIHLRVVPWKLAHLEWLFIVLGNQIEAVFQDGHHAQPQQIDFDDLHVGAVFLIPLNDRTPRHRRWFNGNNLTQMTRANHHAAGVLPEVTRNILHALANLQILGHATVVDIETGGAEAVMQGVGRPLPFPCPHQFL